MIESENPYQAPLESGFPCATPHGETFDTSAFVAWTFVFAANLIVPLLFGWGLTQDHGRTGRLVALVGFLGAGCAFCLSRPIAARKSIAGSVITGVSQVFPILHIISGEITLEITLRFGFVVINNASPMGHDVSGQAEGFLLTLIVGCTLLVCAAGAGQLLGFLLPASWLIRNSDKVLSTNPQPHS